MTCHKKTSELNKWIEQDIGKDTAIIHGGTIPDPITGAVLTPIYNSTTFVQPSVEQYLVNHYSYTRQDNPTVRALENRLCSIYDAEEAVCVSSGMAATTTLFSAFLKTGDHCILPDCSYGGTNRCARVHFSKYNIEFSFVDTRDVDNVAKAIKPNTKMIFTETPSNPVIRLTDIDAVGKLAKKNGILHVCDPTFATPYLLPVFKYNVDIIVESLTKYIDGHNCTVGGVLLMKDKKYYETIYLHRNILGNNMAPFVASTLLLTVKTLALRIRRQSESALKIAKFLEQHPKVEFVSYPGLESFSQKNLADKYFTDGIYGGMLCFEVKGGSEGGRKLMNTIKKPWTLCENLGAAESIITCPSVFTHANMLEEDRLKVGITNGLIRLSVGLETPEDLIQALKEALDNL